MVVVARAWNNAEHNVFIIEITTQSTKRMLCNWGFASIHYLMLWRYSAQNMPINSCALRTMNNLKHRSLDSNHKRGFLDRDIVGLQ